MELNRLPYVALCVRLVRGWVGPSRGGEIKTTISSEKNNAVI
jgi:hypothetical protein